jgi:hypothetical protein
MERRTKIASLYAHLHKKVLKLTPQESLYIFDKKNIVTLNNTVEQLMTKNSEEDGILYLHYAENNPF